MSHFQTVMEKKGNNCYVPIYENYKTFTVYFLISNTFIMESISSIFAEMTPYTEVVELEDMVLINGL